MGVPRRPKLFDRHRTPTVTGLSRSEIPRGRDQLKELLTLEGPPPDSPFQELQTLVPAREFKNRHASILLAFEATLEAIDQAA